MSIEVSTVGRIWKERRYQKTGNNKARQKKTAIDDSNELMYLYNPYSHNFVCYSKEWQIQNVDINVRKKYIQTINK